MTATRATVRPKTGLRIVVAAAVVATIVMNVLANALPFFGRGTGEVSAIYPTLVTPAGYVFAIWGVIYLGLLAYSSRSLSGTWPMTRCPTALLGP